MPNFLDPAFDDATIITTRVVGDPGVVDDNNLQGQSLKDMKGKLGVGTDTPTAGTVLKGTGTGTTEWVPEDELFSGPIDGYGWIVNPATHKPEWMSLSAGAGENNTLANVGTAGVSAVEPKTGTTLNIDGFNSPTGSISITKNADTKTLDMELSTANMPTVPVNKGGTGATTASGARGNLELDQVTNNVQVNLQASTPGTAQTGNTNISGTSKSGSVDTGTFKMGATSGVLRLNSGVATTSTTTDNLPEGSGNLYYTNSRSDARITVQKGNAGGLASLDGNGKVPTDQLPAIAITNTYEVASEAAQLALDVQVGDIAVRSDENKSYVQNGGSAGTMADWTLLRTPTDSVLSVNGKTGSVSLASTDLSDTASVLLKDAVQAVTGKTISGANNTLTVRLGNDVTGQLPVGNGGLGLSTIPLGGIPYASALDTIAALGIGNTGDFLRVAGGIPSWSPVAIPKPVFEKTVDAAGNGDYTTITAALAAGYTNLYVKRGTYNENTAFSTYTATGKSLCIYGEDRKNVKINLAADTAGYIDLKYDGSIISNVTITVPQTSLTSNGWLKVGGQDVILDNVDLVGRGNAYTGSVVYMNGCANFTMQYCNFTGNVPQGGYVQTNGTCNDPRFICNRLVDTYTAGGYRCMFLDNGNTPRIKFIGNYVESANYSPTVGINGAYADVHFNYVIHNTPATSNNITVFSVAGTFCSVMGNTVVNNNSGNGSTLSVSGTNASVIGNRVQLAYYSDTGGTGMYVTGVESAVIGNTVTAATAGETGKGIYVSGNYSTVSGNTVKGFTGTGGKGILIGGNYIHIGINQVENATQRYYDSGTGTMFETPVQEVAVTASTASTSLDLRQYSGFHVAISSNTAFSFADEPSMANKPSQDYVIEVVNDATGSWVITWPANVVWPGGTVPTPSGANKTDFYYLKWKKSDQKYFGKADLNY